MEKINFKITNLHCAACVKISAMALKKIPGVKNAEVKSDGCAMVESDKEITKEEILNALAEADKTAAF